jgi:acyl-CoA reductase-like NAD-dependent aldehyde dehydrogenase
VPSAPPTFPMLVGGRLRRAGTGRGRPVYDGPDHDGTAALVGFATAASPTDLADAVAAARAALPGWAATSVHERGRVLGDLAEILDERRDRLDDDPADTGAAVDRWLWYAGWTDKIADLRGGVHPVDGPYTSWSTPRPIGVVGVLAGSLRGLVDGLASVLAVGATAVVVTPPDRARALGTLAEILATGGLPPGAANLLTGDVAPLGRALARAAVDGLDLAGAPPDGAADLARAAGDRGVRVLPVAPADPLARLRAWTEVTTVWQSVGR